MKKFLLLLFFLNIVSLNAQKNQWKIFHPVDSTISCIEQDKDGNLWFGTWNNLLIKFDWKNWILYTQNTSQLTAEAINGIASDSKGNIWLASGEPSIIRFDGTNWEYISASDYAEHLNPDIAWDIAVDSNDNIWVGTRWGGLLKFDGEKWINYNSHNSLIPFNMEEINSIDVDEENHIWLGCQDGAIKFDNDSTWTIFDSIGTVRGIRAHNGIVSASGGIYKIYKNGKWTLYQSFENNKPPFEIISAGWNYVSEIDSNNNIWLIGITGEIQYSHDRKFKNIIKICEDSVTVIFPDTNKYDFGYAIALKIDFYNNKWIGYSNGYIAVYNEDGVKGFTTTGIEESRLPSIIFLEQNYPNPFNPTTTIKYSIPNLENQNAIPVQLKVFDILGRKVATLVNRKQSPGNYSVVFNAESAVGGLNSGIYYYRLESKGFAITKKMVLLK